MALKRSPTPNKTTVEMHTSPTYKAHTVNSNTLKFMISVASKAREKEKRATSRDWWQIAASVGKCLSASGQFPRTASKQLGRVPRGACALAGALTFAHKVVRVLA